MSAPRSTTPRRLVAGTLLVVAGLASWALYVKQSGSERHSYSRGGNPPARAQLVTGKTYWIAIHGGVEREIQLGVDPGGLQCTAALPGQAPGALKLNAQDRGTKATDQIASFVSAVTGNVQVECARIGAVYVDNAVDAPYDWSGTWLVLASLALIFGLPLVLSALRSSAGQDGSAPDVELVDPAAEGVR